jgi:excisionase family DNA binding protein
MPEFLTTREVAELLRIKERKVYELVSGNAIPTSRVTGKLLFPRDLVEAWVRAHVEFRDGVEGLVARPLVMAGSHDPLLDWALRESGSGIATFFDGSLDGFARMARGKAVAAGVHVFEPETGDWNRGHVTRQLHGQPVVLVEWAHRMQGLVVAPGNPRRIAGIGDLAGLRFVPRQPSAGSRLLFDHLLRQAGIAAGQVTMLDRPARNEADVALAISDDKADVGLAVESVARQYRLDFVPVQAERYDLVVWRHAWFEEPMQGLLAFCRSDVFRDRAAELGGYDISGLGAVRYNGP